MEDLIYLYPGIAPYSAESPEQAQPSLKPYPVPDSRGAVIVCAGGAYCFKTDYEAYPIARMFNSQGISAYVLDYRVKPCHREAPLSDAKRAIRLLRSLGWKKIAILGFSAGGNLCTSAATLYDAGDPENADPVERFSSRPDVFIPCYAVASFGQYTHMGTRRALLGEADKDDPALIRRFSAEENVTDDTPPAFIWHTAEDGAVPVQNALNLANALAEHHVPFELHVYPYGQHGLGLAAETVPVNTWADSVTRFLLCRGFGV